MTRQPRETYVSPRHNGFPSPSAVVTRRRVAAIGVLGLVAVGIAVTVAVVLAMTSARLPSAPQAAFSDADDGATGEISISDPISPFDTDHPAVSRLDPALRDAVQAAAADAEADGIELLLTSGWRSADYQAGLLNNAIAEYGSESAARELVSTPEQSKHVTGQAVDIARVDPALWLEQYGNAYGLCRAFVNETWHFELLTSPGSECPPMLANASEAG